MVEKLGGLNTTPKEGFREIPEMPGIILDGKHLRRDQLTMDILERALDQASLDQQKHILKIIILYAKQLEFDKLTGLSNLNLLKPKLNRLIERLNSPENRRKSELDSVLVVSIDMVGLKFLNEPPYNHAKGNEALITLANRLNTVLRREGDSAFRLHGDEFLLVLPIDSNHESADELYERVKKDVNEGLHIEGEPNKLDLLVRASFGHTIVKKDDPRTTDQILHDADQDERQNKAERYK